MTEKTFVQVASSERTPPSLTDSYLAVDEAVDELMVSDRFIDRQRPFHFLASFSKIYKEKQFTDVTLCVANREFTCHKNVLSVSSPYFMAMFSNDLAESKQNRIELKEMDPLTMELVLDYIYSGTVHLSEETVQNLLSAANLFQLISLRTGCAEFMMNHINVSNCIGVYFFARAHECCDLAVKAKEIINNQFIAISKLQEFSMLPVDKLVEIIRDDDINVLVEESVFEACMAWINYDLASRSEHVGTVMRHVRFGNISSYFFCDKIDRNEILNKNDELVPILDKVRYYHMLRNRQHEIDLDYMPRRGMVYERGVLILANPYTEDSLKKCNSVELLLPNTGEVINICKLPQSLYTPGCCVTGDNQIFLAGGAIRKMNYRGTIMTEGISNSFYQFDQEYATWKHKASMIHARSQFCLAVLDDYLFAVGGAVGGVDTIILSTVERYDARRNLWETTAPLPQPLRFMAATSYRGQLYVFGGETTSDISTQAYRYDPRNDTWVTLPCMKIPRVLAVCVVYKERIYVIGGNSAISDKWKKEFLPEHCVSSVEVFDPATETWSDGPELPNALCGAGVIKYANTIIIVGGEDDKSWMACLCWLKDEDGKQEWLEVQELPTVMSTFGYAVVNMHHDTLKHTS